MTEEKKELSEEEAKNNFIEAMNNAKDYLDCKSEKHMESLQKMANICTHYAKKVTEFESIVTSHRAVITLLMLRTNTLTFEIKENDWKDIQELGLKSGQENDVLRFEVVHSDKEPTH